MSSLLTLAGANVVSTNIFINATQFVKDRCVTNSLTFDAGGSWPFKNHSFQVVIMLDVIEHIEDDIACLHEARRVLRRGGMAVLTVPAHQFLFSSWDKLVGSSGMRFDSLKVANRTIVFYCFEIRIGGMFFHA